MAKSQKIRSDASDPRSINYKRHLVRPYINWGKAAAFVLAPMILSALAAYVFVLLGGSVSLSVAATCIICFAFYAFNAKRIVIFCVKVYQRYASDDIRNRCRFEPSCSEYMISAIEKYGLFKGVRKGIKRLRRCNIHGGGYDYP